MSQLADDIPPGVAAARQQLGLEPEVVPRASGVALGPSVCSKVTPVPGTPAPSTPGSKRAWEVQYLTTEAGEVWKRSRRDGPWEPAAAPHRLDRGSSRLALSIAGSRERTQQASSHFTELVYAPSTNNVKEALWNLWTRVAEQTGANSLPLTPESIFTVAAILREAGFRAIMNYVSEAKDRHLRAGYQWSPQLQATFQDCKRASKRAQGEQKRAEETKPDWWQTLHDTWGLVPQAELVHSQGPFGGIPVFALGISFLLRETELAHLALSKGSVKVDRKERTITLCLSVSKTDVAGKGVRRTLKCSCSLSSLRRNVMCPFHNGAYLLECQLARLGLHSQETELADELPFIGTVEDPRKFVSKDAMIKEAQRLVQLMTPLVPASAELDVKSVTGHFMRRSGVKDLARKGCSFQAIQWMARHSSSVTWSYIEDAMEECPSESCRLSEHLTILETVNQALSQVKTVEEAIRATEEKLILSFAELPAAPVFPSRHELRNEIREAMIPKYVLGLDGRKRLHQVNPVSCMYDDVAAWSTRCGWKWIGSSARPFFESEEPETVEFSKCLKCFSNSG